MKKIIAILLALTVLFAFAACGGNKTPTDADTASDADKAAYADAVEVLTTVFAAYAEENKFAVCGGDENNQTMEGPGKYDAAKADELVNVAALPEAQGANIEDAATALHLQNANSFTGAAYLLKDGADAVAFAEEFKTGLDGRQWMCGFPEKFVVIKTGNYIITAYGLGDNINYFKDTAATALAGAEVLAEGDIVA